MNGTASRIVYRHRHIGGSAGCPGCKAALPLNLAERELITGRSLTQIDEGTGLEFCVDCLADLPASEYEALFHVCGEDPGPAPEPAAAVDLPEPEPVVVVPPARVGDVVRYHGSLAEYCGGVWEVTVRDRRGLRLFDVDRALYPVPLEDVTVVQAREQIRRIKRRKR